MSRSCLGGHTGQLCLHLSEGSCSPVVLSLRVLPATSVHFCGQAENRVPWDGKCQMVITLDSCSAFSVLPRWCPRVRMGKEERGY